MRGLGAPGASLPDRLRGKGSSEPQGGAESGGGLPLGKKEPDLGCLGGGTTVRSGGRGSPGKSVVVVVGESLGPAGKENVGGGIPDWKRFLGGSLLGSFFLGGPCLEAFCGGAEEESRESDLGFFCGVE